MLREAGVGLTGSKGAAGADGQSPTVLGVVKYCKNNQSTQCPVSNLAWCTAAGSLQSQIGDSCGGVTVEGCVLSLPRQAVPA